MKRFNLVNEPWIQVLDKENRHSTKSLIEVLRDAHTLRELAGETPQQDVAINRLLLGILYSVYTREDMSGKKLGAASKMRTVWKELWGAGKFTNSVAAYLERYSDRFWLIHPEFPFWQAREFTNDDTPVRKNGDKILPFKEPNAKDGNQLTSIVGDSMGSGTFGGNPFGIRREVPELSLDEAARWLVYYNSFALSTSGAAGDDFAKQAAKYLDKLKQWDIDKAVALSNGKKVPKEPVKPTVAGYKGTKVQKYRQPYPAYASHVTVLGENLFETLMLNLVLGIAGKPWPSSEAWWEKPHPFEKDRAGNGLADIEINKPAGIVEYMSTQYRYLRLLPSEHGDSIKGVKIWSGVKYTDELKLEVETSAIWEKVTVSNEHFKKGDIKHKRPSSLPTQVWRDLGSLLVQNLDGEVAPQVLLWLHEMSSPHVGNVKLPKLRLSVCGVKYKDGTAKLGDYQDVLSVNDEILVDLGDKWSVMVPKELSKTADKMKAYARFIEDVQHAKGVKEVDSKYITQYTEALYRKLDIPFREWLRSLGSESDEELESSAWQATVVKLILAEADTVVKDAGQSAFVGRNMEVKDGKLTKRDLFTAPKAYNNLYMLLRKGVIDSD